MGTHDASLRAAVIGLGFVGAGDQVSGDAIGQRVADLDGTHAHALATHPNVRLVAGSSRDQGRRERFVDRFAVPTTYADWREMLRAEALDIVSIATNSPYHAEITVACAEAGVRAVFCEKPIATRLVDADRAIRACHNHGTLLAVSHNRRWHPMWRTIRAEIQNGAVGDVLHAMVHWTGGRLGNVGTHLFDALRMVLQVDVQVVTGALDPVIPPDCRGPAFRDPGGWGVVEFHGGTKAFVHSARVAGVPLVLRVVGSRGQLTLCSDEACVVDWDGNRRTLSVPGSHSSSLDVAVQDIVRCLVEGGRPASTGEDGREALEVIIGFHVSDRLGGGRVSLPISGGDRDLEVPIG